MNEECSLNPGSGGAASGREQAQILQVEPPWGQFLQTPIVVRTWGITACSEQSSSAGEASSCSGKPSTCNCYLMLFLLEIGITVTPRLEAPRLSSVSPRAPPGQPLVSPWSPCSAPGPSTAREEQTGPLPGLPSLVGGSGSQGCGGAARGGRWFSEFI